MVDVLKRSVNELEPPICPDCRVEMMWYRAIRKSRAVIHHFFMCDDCHRVLEMKTRVMGNGEGPPAGQAKAAKAMPPYSQAA